jgi:hypothetical protein
MRIARLGVAGAAAGFIALGMAGPAFATGTTPPPSGDVSKATPSTGGRPGSGPVADVNPKAFFAGDTLTFTLTNCGVHPTISDVNNLFVKTNPFVETSKGSWAAKETTHKNIIEGKEYKVVVKCGDFVDTFTTKPHKRPKPTPTPTSSSPTTTPTGVPSGAPQTGDGSSSGGGNTGLMAAGAVVVLAGLAGGTFLYTRRRSSAGA